MRLRLIYFDFDGGRGEVARIALGIGEIPFEDDRIAFADWERTKPAMPFGALPVLEADGRMLAQSNAINRYVGRLAGLYPDDPWQAALCDEAMDAVEEIGARIVTTFDLPDTEKKTRRQAMAAGAIPFFLDRLARRLGAQGGRYFADDRLTVADLKLFLWIRHLRSGALDHIPADLPDRVAPALVEHLERVGDHPGVASHLARRRAAAVAA